MCWIVSFADRHNCSVRTYDFDFFDKIGFIWSTTNVISFRQKNHTCRLCCNRAAIVVRSSPWSGLANTARAAFHNKYNMNSTYFSDSTSRVHTHACLFISYPILLLLFFCPFLIQRISLRILRKRIRDFYFVLIFRGQTWNDGCQSQLLLHNNHRVPPRHKEHATIVTPPRETYFTRIRITF